MKRKLENARKRILKLVPDLKNLNIKMNRDVDGQYRTKIQLHLPKRKTLFANKIANTTDESLEKSEQAIIKQFKKLKNRRHFKQRSRIPISA